MGNFSFFQKSLPMVSLLDCRPDFLVELFIQPCQQFILCHIFFRG